MEAGREKATRTLVADLTRVFGDRLQSVAVYGDAVEHPRHPTLTALALVTHLGQDDLDACAARAPHWVRAGIGTPLLLPVWEFERSLDTFPLEYADILARHITVHGRDPFDGVTINSMDVRRACEKQAKSHLLHLREGYVEAQGNPLAVAQLVTASAPAFAALLRNVARMLGVVAASPAEVARAGAAAMALDTDVVSHVLSLTTSASAVDGARIFPGYVKAVEQLTHAVDTWRP